ncbi:MAG: hypothetical protein KKG75_02710, partial [Nanoarchaeota archaeon]|nr:hypothetical protein [Nanoarchaeota archaeon]
TSNYDNLTNMTTTDTSSPYMYNATISADDISDQSNVSFLIVGNDTEGNEYVLNYSASGQGYNFVVDAVTPIIYETIDNFKPENYGNFSTLTGSNALAINVSANETNTGSEMFVYACLSNSTGCVGGEVALDNETCDSKSNTANPCYWSNSTFNTRNVADGIYNITFNATDLVENSNATDALFTKGLNILVDNTLPVFSYINISDGNTTRTNGTSLNSTFKIDNTQDITVRTSIADGNIDSLYLYYVCNSTNATTTNFYETIKMSTDSTIAARGSAATSSYMYSGTISKNCLEDGNETTFIIVGNDTAKNEFQINDTSISVETLFTITLNSTLVKVSDVNVTDGSYTRTTLDGTEYLQPKLNTFRIELQGEDKDKDGVLLYYNTTGSMSTDVNGFVSGYDDVLVMNNLTDATSSGNSKVMFNTTIDLAGNNSNTVEFYVVANDTSGYAILMGSYSYKIDGGGPSTPTLTAPSTTTIGPSDSIEYSCESSDGGSGIASWTWTLQKPNSATIEKTDTGVSKSTKSFSGTTETGSLGTYTVKCKATDNLGYVSGETSSTFSVSGTAGSTGGSGGGSSSTTLTVSFDVDLSDAKAGTIQAQQGRIKSFSFDGATKHTMTFDKVTASTVTITIASNPITVNLNLKEAKEIDINADGVNDISVTLKSIVNGLANIEISKMEAGAAVVVKEEEAVRGVEKEEVNEEKIEEKITPPEKGGNWLLVVLLIVILIMGIGYYRYKNR